MFNGNLDQASWLYDQIRPYIPANHVVSGYDVNFPCPFCNEVVNAKKRGTRRGHYYIHTQSYYCFRCDKWTHGMDLYSILAGIPVSDIKPLYFKFKYSSNNNSVAKTIETENDKYCIEYNEIPDEYRKPLSATALKYLTDRKIFQAPNLPKNFDFYSYKDKMGEYIVIPWIYNGQECYYQKRLLNGGDIKYLFPKNIEKSVFGLDNIDTSFKYMIATEGVFDCIWIKNGIALGGKALTDYQKWFIAQRYPHHEIVYAFDNDPAGNSAMLKIIEKRPNSKFLNWFDYAKEAKDMNEFVCKYNTNIFNNEDNLKKMIVSGAKMKILLTYNKN